MLAALGGGTGSSSPNLLNRFLSSLFAGEILITLNTPFFSSSKIVAALTPCCRSSLPSLRCWPRCARTPLLDSPRSQTSTFCCADNSWWCKGCLEKNWSLCENWRNENRGTKILPPTISVLKNPHWFYTFKISGVLLDSRLQVNMVWWDRTSEPQQQPWGRVGIGVHNRCSHGACHRPSWCTPLGAQEHHRHHHNQPGKTR